MANKMLDRWCTYSSHGKPILDTRVIAFKVPLRKDTLRQRNPEEWFTVKDLVEAVPNLGLVIDLCNTNKYYNSQELKEFGVKHEKVICVGGSVPTKSVVERFCSLIDKYLQDDTSDKLIGVHCTHGINRTGYLVCRYLMKSLNISPEEAIKAFQDARGHQIERPEFVDYLKNFSDPAFVDTNVRSSEFVPNRGLPDTGPCGRETRDAGFFRPPEGRYRPRYGGKFRSNDGGDFRPRDNGFRSRDRDEFRSRDGDEFKPREGGNFRSREGGDFRPREGGDFRPRYGRDRRGRGGGPDRHGEREDFNRGPVSSSYKFNGYDDDSNSRNRFNPYPRRGDFSDDSRPRNNNNRRPRLHASSSDSEWRSSR